MFVPDNMSLIHPEHPFLRLSSFLATQDYRKSVPGWVNFRALDGSISERRNHSPQESSIAE
jgi:hypothetical protein